MIRGRAHKFGDNIDTDGIIPVYAVNLTEPEELGRYCMANLDPEFAGRVRPGDILVAGKNFGCGSSREVAPWSIKGAGISCVIAESFARIFFRNAINIALPVIICPTAARQTADGDELQIDLSRGEIRNLTQGEVFKAVPYPKFISELIAAGGLVEHIRQRLQREQEPPRP
jgi:3-isopropylmalate/(R)-2-methylmalate dehydratase small subunit